jgi:hypothetical protein
MKIPRYWARARAEATNPDGQRFDLSLWGWSQTSVAEARALAEQRKATVTARVARGEALKCYGYGERALREERLRIIGGDEANPQALVTRNRYGALVLNTARVPFIDVDIPSGAGAPKKLFGVFGRKSDNDPVLDRIREACRRHALQSFRIYRTSAGYRVLATDMTMDPKSMTTKSLLEGFGADPYFILLCQQQESFRARLTAKPWRCDCPLPPGQYPRDEPAVQAEFEAWLRQYDQRSANFAACRFVETVGSGKQSDEARAIVIEHDRATKADSGLALA